MAHPAPTDADLPRTTAIRRARPAHWLRQHPRRALAGAIVASLLAHLIVAAWPERPSVGAEPLPALTATLTEIPPPPAPMVKRVPPKRKPKAVVPAAPAVIATTETSKPVTAIAEDPVVAAAPADVPSAPPAPTEEVLPVAASDAPPRSLPPRIELVYRGFLGTQGFLIGDAVYRLEHGDNRYSITTIGEARGLAALFFRGQGRLTSKGTITSAGLQPDRYTAERDSDGRHETATFDWESGIVLLNGDKTAGLELPTFDPLAVLWQFYFAPPEQDEAEFNVATTRRVYHSRFHRTGVESVKLSFGEFDAEVWERTAGDGNITARVWLAPSLHHVMVKMRLSNGRLTGEALLDSIRVDETVAQQ
jgi:uncharacterized protein DUF3108